MHEGIGDKWHCVEKRVYSGAQGIVRRGIKGWSSAGVLELELESDLILL